MQDGGLIYCCKTLQHHEHLHKYMVLKLTLTKTPVLLNIFKDNHPETEGWYTGITPSNFANIQTIFQIFVQTPSRLASLAPRKLGKTAILTSVLDVVADLMLQPLSFWKKSIQFPNDKWLGKLVWMRWQKEKSCPWQQQNLSIWWL